MIKEPVGHTGSMTSRGILLLSIILALFWYLARTNDVYSNAAIGAFFEILWLPMLLLLFALPVFSFIFWRKEKFSGRSLYLYSFLISFSTTTLVIILNN
jgi:hypothetical protein